MKATVALSAQYPLSAGARLNTGELSLQPRTAPPSTVPPSCHGRRALDPGGRCCHLTGTLRNREGK